MNTSLLIGLIIFSPLLGGVLGLRVKNSIGALSLGIGVSFLGALLVLTNFETAISGTYEWLPGYYFGVWIDKPAAALLVLVTLIGLLVSIFSSEYMKEDARLDNYAIKVGFFVTSMLGLLVADDLFLLFICWELVGFASYLLIGYWYQKQEVPKSARTAFMTNRIADIALLCGILMLFQKGDISMSSFEGEWPILPSVLIALGAFGKSAQLPFSAWLTKAMVGPTPISALIHAATMVAAGVYLLFRAAPMFPDEVNTFIAISGSITALYGGVSALNQDDIKKVLAYSTISQLGYMILGIGVGASEASLFHLWTHAFFKAGLFLGAGSIIHYMHLISKNSTSAIDPQDIRKMGGLRTKLPWTFYTFTICALALAGIPLFSGFLSKENILVATWTWANNYGTWAYIVPDLAMVTSLLTAFYVGKLVLLIFFGQNRMVVQEAPMYRENISIKLPLSILALGSIWLAYTLNPMGHNSYLDAFWGAVSVSADSFAEATVMFISLLLSVGGLLFSYMLFRPKSSFSEGYSHAQAPSSIMGKLVNSGFYLAYLYEGVGRGVDMLGTGLKSFDKHLFDRVVHSIGIGTVVFSKTMVLVDRFIFDGLIDFSALVARKLGQAIAGIQGRNIHWQLIWLLVAFSVVLGWILFF